MTRILGVCLISVLTACGKTNTTTVATVQKPLNSVWVDENSNTFDLTKNEPTWTYGTGGECQFNAAFASSDPLMHDLDAGTMVVSNSATAGVVSGMAPCTQFNGSWTYDLLADGSLEICQIPGSCHLLK